MRAVLIYYPQVVESWRLAGWRGGASPGTFKSYCARITLLQLIVPFSITPSAVVASNVTIAVVP